MIGRFITKKDNTPNEYEANGIIDIEENFLYTSSNKYPNGGTVVLSAYSQSITGSALGSEKVSNSIIVKNTYGAATVSVSNCLISKNGGPYVSSETITTNDIIIVKVITSNSFGNTQVGVATFSNSYGSSTFSLSVQAVSITLSSTSTVIGSSVGLFTDVSSGDKVFFVPNNWISVKSITVTNINSATITCRDSNSLVSINGGAWVSSGTILNGQSFVFRILCPAYEVNTSIYVDVVCNDSLISKYHYFNITNYRLKYIMGNYYSSSSTYSSTTTFTMPTTYSRVSIITIGAGWYSTGNGNGYTSSGAISITNNMTGLNGTSCSAYFYTPQFSSSKGYGELATQFKQGTTVKSLARGGFLGTGGSASNGTGTVKYSGTGSGSSTTGGLGANSPTPAGNGTMSTTATAVGFNPSASSWSTSSGGYGSSGYLTSTSGRAMVFLIFDADVTSSTNYTIY